MRSLLIILGFIVAILAVILSVTPLYKIAYIPAIIALIFGLIAFYILRKNQYPKKSIQLIFLLTIISLTVTTYKSIFSVSALGNIENLESKEKASEEDAIETLEGLDLNELDLDTLPSREANDSIIIQKGS